MEDWFLSHSVLEKKEIRRTDFNVSASGRGFEPTMKGGIELVAAVPRDVHLQIWTERSMQTWLYSWGAFSSLGTRQLQTVPCGSVGILMSVNMSMLAISKYRSQMKQFIQCFSIDHLKISLKMCLLKHETVPAVHSLFAVFNHVTGKQQITSLLNYVTYYKVANIPICEKPPLHRLGIFAKNLLSACI